MTKNKVNVIKDFLAFEATAPADEDF
jgi:hypothetical protein